MKLEETKKLKLSQKNSFHTTTSHIKYVQDSGKELAEKITQILNNHGKNSIFFSGKPSFKNCCNYWRCGHSNAECSQKQQDKVNRLPKHRQLNILFTITRKRSKNTK